MDEILPVGTVLKVKENPFQFMVVGHEYENEGEVYDYVAVIHPVGITFKTEKIESNIFFFQKENIEEIYSLGYFNKDINNKVKHLEAMSIVRKKRKEKNNEK